MTNGLQTAYCKAIEIDGLPDKKNRQWLQIFPTGRFTLRDGRGPFNLDDPQGLIAATKSYHGATNIVVDYEHQTILAKSNGKPAPAAGWFTHLEARSNGIWANVEWTQEAASQIKDRQYRYISPVFNHDNSGKITQVINVALTNAPAIEGMAALAKVENNMENEQIRTALGLEPTSSTTDVLGAITKLQETKTEAASAQPDATQFVPIALFEEAVAEGNKLRQGISQQAASTHVGECVRSGKLAPFLRDWAIEMCTSNKPKFDEFMARTGPFFSGMSTSQMASVNFDEQPNKPTGLESEVCDKLGISTEDYAAAQSKQSGNS